MTDPSDTPSRNTDELSAACRAAAHLFPDGTVTQDLMNQASQRLLDLEQAVGWFVNEVAAAEPFNGLFFTDGGTHPIPDPLRPLILGTHLYDE